VAGPTHAGPTHAFTNGAKRGGGGGGGVKVMRNREQGRGGVGRVTASGQRGWCTCATGSPPSCAGVLACWKSTVHIVASSSSSSRQKSTGPHSLASSHGEHFCAPHFCARRRGCAACGRCGRGRSWWTWSWRGAPARQRQTAPQGVKRPSAQRWQRRVRACVCVCVCGGGGVKGKGFAERADTVARRGKSLA
jgi:hypothetical protein